MALTDNLLAWYKFNEASGNAADSSGNGHTLTNSNSTAFVTGKIGNAADLVPASGNGFNDSTSPTWPSIGGDATIQVWFYPDANHGAEGAGLVAYLSSEAVGNYMLAWGSQRIYAYDRPTAGSWRVYQTPASGVSLSNWHHIVWRRSSDTVTIWIDGSSVSVTSAGGATTGWGTPWFIIGGYTSADPGYIPDGKVDMVGVWDRAISDSEIGQLYNGGTGFDHPFSGGGTAHTKSVADPLTLGESVASVLTPQVTYFGSASVPADGAAAVNATTTLTITPPGSMTTGDLVVVSCVSGASATWSVGLTGGQTWTSETAYQATTFPFCRIFWCRYNGTWSVNPRFDSTVGTNTSAIMHVFRPPATTYVWAIDVAQATTQYSAPSTPFTVSRTGLTAGHDHTVALACWHSADDNTWGTLAGTGWVVTGTAQYRNTSGTPDNSSSFAHYIAPTASTSVPNVSKNQATLGGDLGVTAIIAFYAAAGALTKSLSDGLSIGETRTGAAGFARGLPDALTVNEVLGRLWQFQRSFADALTMNESVVAAKALLMAYADALALGELVDKQISMAAYSDDFNRANSSTLGSSWNENVSGVSILDNALGFISTGAYSSAVWTQPVPISCQYQKAMVSWTAGKDCLIGMLFRCSNTTSGSCYKIVFETATDTVYWDSVPNMTSPSSSTSIGTASLTIAPGNTIGITLELLGNNTIVRIWLNPTGLPTRANNWNGDTTPNLTMTQNPATPRDAGTFLGLIGAPLEADADLEWDDWYGGGCLESTGVLFSKDLFDDVVLNETLAKAATLLRGHTDPILLTETFAKAATFRRSPADPLALSEALSRRVGKTLTDPITLTEAVAKALVIAKAVADGLSLNEAIALARAFTRSLSDPLALTENMAKISAFAKLLSDPLVLTETLAKVSAFRRSLDDPLSLGDPVSTSLAGAGVKSVSDPLALSEALALVWSFRKSLSDALTLGENVLSQLVLVRAVSDALAIGEAVLTQLVALLTVAKADPLTLADVIDVSLIITVPSVPGGTGGYTSRGFVMFERALPEPAPKEAWPSPEERAAICAIVNFVTGEK